MNNLITVDFDSKQLKDSPLYSEDQVYGALEIIYSFMNEDLKQKKDNMANALQIMMHDIENVEDEDFNTINSEQVLKRIRTLRKGYREVKQLEFLQNKLKKELNATTIKEIKKKKDSHCESIQRGSCDLFYENSVKNEKFSNNTLQKFSRLSIVK